MFNFKQLPWILACIFLFAGCATQPGKNKMGSTSGDAKESAQTPHDLETMYQLGRKYQDEARFTEAITTYENILAIDPNYAECPCKPLFVHAHHLFSCSIRRIRLAMNGS